MPHYVVTRVKVSDAPDHILTEKRDVKESYLLLSDVLDHIAEKLAANSEKLEIQDKGMHFRDEAPEGDFNFKVKDLENGTVYAVKVEGNRKEKNANVDRQSARQTGGQHQHGHTGHR